MSIHPDNMKPALIGLLLAVFTLVLAACGGDSGSDPTPTPECAISGVNTSQQASWLTGATVNIRWTQNGVPGTVKIELLKAGSPVAVIAAAAPNTGFYPWLAATGGQPNGSDFGIRITGTGEASCTSQVTGLTIREVAGCGLTFTGDVDSVFAGETYEITWTSNNTSGRVDIELWTSGIGNTLGEMVGEIARGTEDDGSLSWTVRSFNNGSYNFYRYVIRDVQVADCEVVSPRFAMIDDDICTTAISGPSGLPLRIGDRLDLMLEQTNGSGTVNLRLFTGNEYVRGGVVADNVSVLRDTFWIVTDFNNVGDNTRYNIRAIDVEDPYCIDKTSNFTINP